MTITHTHKHSTQVWKTLTRWPRPPGVTRATTCLHSNSPSRSCDAACDGAKTQLAVDCVGGDLYVCVCVEQSMSLKTYHI